MDRYCLIGSPVAHSLSPAMMNRSFSLLGMDAAYGLRETTLDGLSSAVEELVREGYRGWNVTMPLKQAMAGLCDRLSPESEIGGSVNTVKNDGGVLTGFTTDGTGAVRALSAAGIPVRGSRLTLLGTGGAARAILIRAALDGAARLSVFYNSPKSRGIICELRQKLGARSLTEIEVLPLSDRDLLTMRIRGSAALINATSVGMEGGPDPSGCPLPDPSCLSGSPYVYDIIYHPTKTPLMKMAEDAGCGNECGISMLLYQGAASFRIWTGRDMPVDDILPLLMSSL